MFPAHSRGDGADSGSFGEQHTNSQRSSMSCLASQQHRATVPIDRFPPSSLQPLCSSAPFLDFLEIFRNFLVLASTLNIQWVLFHLVCSFGASECFLRSQGCFGGGRIGVKTGNVSSFPFSLCSSAEAGAGERGWQGSPGPCVHTWPCLSSLHTHTAELLPDSLSCFVAAAPEVRVAVHARKSSASLLEKVFSGNWFLPKALPVPGGTEGVGSLICSSV